jgi:hypothetical protein
VIGFFSTVLALFIYSFTQVDLSLTLSRASIYQVLEKYLQNIGFFQRPLSTLIYVIILSALLLFYIKFLQLAFKKRLDIKTLWKIIVVTAIILAFSYNAFSYDLFNYIFDAKILTHYHLNPYLYRALDFSTDPMLNFMRWTQRTLPYGPSWIALTAPLSFIGMNVFLVTFFLFKLLMLFSFLGSSYLIYKISEIIFPEDKLLNLTFFALNPLILIESLVSAHNDIPMIFFLLLSLYLFLKKKNIPSVVFYIFSIGIKFSTGVLFPLLLILGYLRKIGKKIDWEVVFIISILLSLVTVVLASIRTTFQPWYLILPLVFSSLISRKNYILIPSIVATIFALSIYIPYVYMTDYAKEYPILAAAIEAIGLVSVVTFASFYLLKAKISLKH